jgi:Arm DNA-binding domain
MAREVHRLTALAISKKKKPGTYADGGGLWLQVTETGTKSWCFRFMLDGRAREMGLGPLHTVPLTDAREQARACRALRLDGVDPIEHRKLRRAENVLQMSCAKTFDQCAAGYIEAQRLGWSNPKHADQWTNTLNRKAEERREPARAPVCQDRKFPDRFQERRGHCHPSDGIYAPDGRRYRGSPRRRVE